MKVTNSIVKKNLRNQMSYNSLHANSDRKSCEIGSHTKVQILNGFNKRKAQLVLDGKKEKRQRMDPRVKRQCGVILEALITHPYAWVFRTPVNPVVWNIPDYFSIISDPMDLGTVEAKLAGNRYFTAEEFAFDVKLTFSNAMLYNPPDHDVHVMAKQLQCIFIRRWKLIDAKLKSITASAQQGMISCGSEKTAQDKMKACSNKSLDWTSSAARKNAQCKKLGFASGLLAKSSMSLEEKRKLRKDLLEMLKGKMNGKLCTVLQKFGFFGIRKEKIDLDIDALDDGILWELKRVLKDSSHASSAKHNKVKILPTKMQTQDHGCKSLSTSARRLDLVSGCQLTDSSRSGLHEENTCPSSRLSRTVTTAISAERSTCPIDDKEALKKDKILPTQMKIQDHEREHLSTSARRLDLVSDYQLTEDSGSGLEKDTTCRSSGISTTVTTAISAEGCTPIDDAQALKRALRDAMLRSRFAEIISKANGGKADVQERMNRLQHEEEAFKARIREQQLKEEDELKRQTEKEREAARIALQMMERTIEFEDNLTTLKELEMLSQCASTYILHGCEPVMVFRALKTGKVFNPLEQLGLHIKEEFMADEEEEIVLGWEGEEGEILE
ncbi:hypothetical protein ACH5RR_015443 [Cinchona calisaya]|uniref:Bromo domain-containing protein n=1 Tax=Cinchona calisaya TaxID=153742 RepID=A0ABD2ZT66_9GENT